MPFNIHLSLWLDAPGLWFEHLMGTATKSSERTWVRQKNKEEKTKDKKQSNSHTMKEDVRKKIMIK